MAVFNSDEWKLQNFRLSLLDRDMKSQSEMFTPECRQFQNVSKYFNLHCASERSQLKLLKN